MTRIINLNGRWQLSYTGEIYDKTIDIPGTIEITELSYPDPESLTGYFRRMIQLDEEDMKKNKWLKFYASDLETDVFLNGEQIGHHKGGFDAFEYDVGELLNRMENELVVKVSDKPIHQAGNEITGKQDWYGNITGLWQKVELKIVDRQFIRETAFEIHQDYIDLSLDIHGSWQRIAYVIFDGENCVGRGESETSDFRIPRNTLRLWSPEEPKRYRLNLSLKNGTDILDQTTCWIGFREIEQRDHQLFLNGKPFYMKGLLDQDFYPETDYVPPSIEFMRDELIRIRQLGFNTVRYHVKTPPSEYVELADELGLLLWIDLPYAKAFDAESKSYLERLRDDLMMRYSSSPSFCILTLINESWGIDLSQFDENKWLFDFWKESKLCIRDRLIVDNSACLGNHHVSSDLNDFHFYHAYPEKEAEWNETVKAFAENSFLPFKAVDDSEKVCRPETLPKIISEFGVWSLSDPVLWQGKWIDYENMSYQVRDFMKSTVDGFYNSSALFKGVQWQAFYALKHQIEEMRIYPEISGFVLTELSDISWEANGILDYSRNDKPFTQYMKMLNQDLLPILRKNGEIYISNISNTPIEGEISVTCEGDVLYAGSFKSLPNSCTKVSDCEIEGINGMVTLEFITVDNRSFVNFRNLYAGRKETCFYIADQLDDESYKTAEKGERVYIHLNKPGNFEGFDVIPAKTPLGAIAGMNFDGDWISGFYYYHPELLGYLNYENGSEELCGSFRDTVIVNTKEYDVLIGKMIGWNLAPCACVIRKRVGRGEIIISTLDLEATQKLYLLG